MRHLFRACALTILGLAMASPASAQLVGSDLSCLDSPTGHIQWTSGDNVWEFDFVRPALTRTAETPNGAGVELLKRDVQRAARLSACERSRSQRGV